MVVRIGKTKAKNFFWFSLSIYLPLRLVLFLFAWKWKLAGLENAYNGLGERVAYVTNEATSPSSHRPSTTTPSKPTVIMTLSANPLATLAGACPVYGDGEGREVEVLDEEPVAERMEEFWAELWPPTGRHNTSARTAISAGAGEEVGMSVIVLFQWDGWGQVTYFWDRSDCTYQAHIFRDSCPKIYCRRCKCGLSDCRTQTRGYIYRSRLAKWFVAIQV